MIRRRLLNIKIWLQIRGLYSKEQQKRIIDLIQSQAVGIHVDSCLQFETLFKILPRALQCNKEDTSANRRFEWWKKYPYISYHEQFERIECFDYPRCKTVVSYEEFWNTVCEKQPKLNRHRLEDLL